MVIFHNKHQQVVTMKRYFYYLAISWIYKQTGEILNNFATLTLNIEEYRPKNGKIVQLYIDLMTRNYLKLLGRGQNKLRRHRKRTCMYIDMKRDEKYWYD